MARPCLGVPQVLGIALSVCLSLHASAVQAQCTKDTDCKGERICQSGTCVEPEARPAAPTVVAPAPPAAVQAPPPCPCPPATACVPPMLAGAEAPAAMAHPALPPRGIPVGPTGYGGPFVRLSAGLGWFRTDFSHDQRGTYSASSHAGSFSGTALVLGAAVGGPVSGSLFVYGEALASFVSDPSADNGAWEGDALTTWDGTYGLVSFGPGLSYYFEGSNAYVSFALTLTRVFGKEIDSDYGMGGNLGIGKEWREASGWGTGILVGLQFASADDQYRGTATSLVPSVRFSATWN